MNDINPPPFDTRSLPGWFTPDPLAEPRPPFQMRRSTELYLLGRASAEIAARVLPKGMKMEPDGFFTLAFCDFPEGWGPTPFRWFYLGLDVEGYNSADGSLAIYMVAGTVSGRAGDILPRDYNTLYRKGDIDFSLADTTVSASAPLDGGEGRISLSAERVSEPPGTNAGVVNLIGADGASGLTICSVGFSFSFTSLTNMRIEVDLPPGHRLDFLRDLRPDWGIYMWDKAASISAPQPLADVYGDPSGRMAFLDAVTRIGRAVALVEQTGRIAFLTREAEVLLKDDAGLSLTRLPAAASRSALASPLADPLRQPALITLASGRQLTARAFPIALRLGYGPLAMVLLTDPRASGPTEPEPLLRLMGLTPAEAALANLIGQGIAPAEAACQRGITLATARSSLKTIFAKLGVSRQSELAILVTRLQSA